MALSVNTNIAALNAYRNLSSTQNDLSKSLEKLSSGLRINRAADDAAGLAISEGLRAQIGGTTQAVRNAQDGISVVQTAEGALTETHSILQRMRTLSVQASNDGGLSDTAKKNIQDEMGQLQTELTRIADTTQFNGTKLLDGDYKGVFQVGANTSSQDKITVSIGNDLTGGLSAGGLGVDALDVTRVADFTSTAYTYTAAAGALTVAGVTVMTATTTTTASEVAAAINASTDVALQGKVSAEVNADGQLVVTTRGALRAADAAVAAPTAAAVGTGLTAVTGSTVTGIDKAAGAIAAIDSIDDAITTVSSVRSELGAVQNRFDHTINNLNVAVENLTASESRIRDTDMASEMVSYTRASILSQAGTAMLAQAKNLPQSVLQLLQ